MLSLYCYLNVLRNRSVWVGIMFITEINDQPGTGFSPISTFNTSYRHFIGVGHGIQWSLRQNHNGVRTEPGHRQGSYLFYLFLLDPCLAFFLVLFFWLACFSSLRKCSNASSFPVQKMRSYYYQAAGKRTKAERSATARRAVRTKETRGRSLAAKKAARTSARTTL